jgi:phage-related minor tail protein
MTRLRFIPRDHGLLERVRSEGLAALEVPARQKAFTQALSRLARRLGRVEVGLALGAGMAKGFPSGRFEGLQRAHVPSTTLRVRASSIVASVYAGGMAWAAAKTDDRNRQAL